jgi:hypothetical protein
LQVVASENVSDLVDEASPCLSGFFAKRRQSPIRLISAGGDVDLSQAAVSVGRLNPATYRQVNTSRGMMLNNR